MIELNSYDTLLLRIIKSIINFFGIECPIGGTIMLSEETFYIFESKHIKYKISLTINYNDVTSTWSSQE